METRCFPHKGWLAKLGGMDALQRRFFVLEYQTSSVDGVPQPAAAGLPHKEPESRLLYFDTEAAANGGEASKAKGVLLLTGAKIIDRGTYRSKPAFSIEAENTAKGQKEYFLFSDEAADKWRWMASLMVCSGRYPFLLPSIGICPSSPGGQAKKSAMAEAIEAASETRLKKSSVYHLLCRPENQRCADCGAPSPSWAVLDPFGVFVCIECVGVHRGLWANKCKETQLDVWSPEAVAFMEMRGNKAANEELEFHCVEAGGQPTIKPQPSSTRAVREAFIKVKYTGRFVAKANGNASPMPAVADPAVPQEAQQPPQEGQEGTPPGSGVPKAGSSTTAVETASAIAAAVAKAVEVFSKPPKYSGVVFLQLLSASGLDRQKGIIVVLTNGFQEVRSMPSAKGDDGEATWRQPLQIGLDVLERPLYFSFVSASSGDVEATAELVLADVFDGATASAGLLADDGAAAAPINAAAPVWGKLAGTGSKGSSGGGRDRGGGKNSGPLLRLSVSFVRLT